MMTAAERASEVFYKYVNHHALYVDDGPRIIDRLTLAMQEAEQEATASIAAENERLRTMLWKATGLANEIRYQMGTTFGSTRNDEAYAEGWNDLRIKMGRELLELADAALYPQPTVTIPVTP